MKQCALIAVSIAALVCIPGRAPSDDDFDRALKNASAGLAEFGNDHAWGLLREGSFDLAAKRFTDMIADDNEAVRPYHAQAHYGRGLAFRGMGHFQDAIDEFDEWLSFSPSDKECYRDRSIAYRSLLKYNEAIRDCTKAIELDPDYALAYVSRAEAYRLKREYRSAIADCAQAIQLKPELPLGHGIRGSVHLSQGRLELAIKDFTEAIRLDPDYANAYLGRARAYALRKEDDRAIADLTTASPQDLDGTIHLAKATIHLQARKFVDARTDLAAAVKLNPNDEEAQAKIAWLLATCPDAAVRDGKEAVTRATKACELTRWEDPYCLVGLAAACAESGDFEKAVNYQINALATPDVYGAERLKAERDRLALYQAHKPWHDR